jgi:hypothetical protein
VLGAVLAGLLAAVLSSYGLEAPTPAPSTIKKPETSKRNPFAPFPPRHRYVKSELAGPDDHLPLASGRPGSRTQIVLTRVRSPWPMTFTAAHGPFIGLSRVPIGEWGRMIRAGRWPQNFAAAGPWPGLAADFRVRGHDQILMRGRGIEHLFTRRLLKAWS